jgi:hypothetical protein
VLTAQSTRPPVPAPVWARAHTHQERTATTPRQATPAFHPSTPGRQAPIVWARLKVEIAWIRDSIWFATRAEAHAYLFEFIEVFYNRQRHQGGLGHLTPAEYADKWRHDHGQPNPS